ncbi:DUF2291 family protein [Sphingomonas hengshuiensis]|uniref:DUF2291 family protein n=1 Tax=Sphingomonas hengshuiensis TaxID=1609977 RepID=UPI00138E1E85|nr:DUF2291 domain-containing protein [Sphingomonas hengshuiensis]
MAHPPRPNRSGYARTGGALLACALLGGCTLLPIDEARMLRERSSGSFDATRYVAEIWDSRARPALAARTVAIDAVRTADLDRFGAEQGRRAGEGSPWTFVVEGEAVVREARTDQPRGTLTIDTPGGGATILTGPVISGSAIRDALPFIRFDGFSDQIAYAEVGAELTERALRPLQPTLRSLRVGDRVRFRGVASIVAPGDPIAITPFEIARIGGGDAAR